MLHDITLKTLPVLASGLMLLTGCVANQPEKADVCPPNKTLVCEQRMGKGREEDCTCRNKAQMRDVFDLGRKR